MTDSEIQCLKDSIGTVVEIETTNGEVLVARVLFVFHDGECGEHELFYEVVSSNKQYKNLDSAGGYALDFEQILSVKAIPNPEEEAKS